MIGIIVGSIVGVWVLSHLLFTWHVGRKHLLWPTMPLSTKLKIILISPVGVPVSMIQSWREDKRVRRVAQAAFARTKVADEQTILVDTLEGFRSLMGATSTSGKRVKLSGKFPVPSTIEVMCSRVLLDLEEAELDHKGIPLFWVKGQGVIIKDLKFIADTDLDLIPAGDDTNASDHNKFTILVCDGAAAVIMGYTQKDRE